MSIEHTATVMEGYWSGDDPEAIAPDAVFTEIASGRQWIGRDQVRAMLEEYYATVFDAEFIVGNRYIADGLAAVEGRFVGTHIGEYAGVPGTGKQIDVPLAVFYTVGEHGITEGRVWFMLQSFLEQVS